MVAARLGFRQRRRQSAGCGANCYALDHPADEQPCGCVGQPENGGSDCGQNYRGQQYRTAADRVGQRSGDEQGWQQSGDAAM
jgi:hypothetical protein